MNTNTKSGGNNSGRSDDKSGMNTGNAQSGKSDAQATKTVSTGENCDIDGNPQSGKTGTMQGERKGNEQTADKNGLGKNPGGGRGADGTDQQGSNRGSDGGDRQDGQKGAGNRG